MAREPNLTPHASPFPALHPQTVQSVVGVLILLLNIGLVAFYAGLAVYIVFGREVREAGSSVVRATRSLARSVASRTAGAGRTLSRRKGELSI